MKTLLIALAGIVTLTTSLKATDPPPNKAVVVNTVAITATDPPNISLAVWTYAIPWPGFDENLICAAGIINMAPRFSETATIGGSTSEGWAAAEEKVCSLKFTPYGSGGARFGVSKVVAGIVTDKV